MLPVIAILVILGLIVYFVTKKKNQQVFPNTTNSPKMPDHTGQDFQSKISSVSFPDRVDQIVWHINAIEKGLANGDLNLANISYAKLIESIRQQNINEIGKHEDALQTITEEYNHFRQQYGFEYPEQFLPPSQRLKSQPIADSNSNPKSKVLSNSSKLNALIKEISSKGHPEYPLLRKEYAVTSGIPYRDFSGWVIEQLKQKDYNSLYAFIKEFYLGSDTSGELTLKRNYEKFLTKNFKSLFIHIDEQAIYEIQTFFIIKRGIDDFNRGFWIAEDKDAELLSKILSVYSFSINSSTFEPLIKKVNKFIQDRRKDIDYWKDYKTYKIEELKIENNIETTTDFIFKIKQLMPGERLYFFDFATTYSYRKFWNGDSTFKTRSYGINENESFDKISSLGLFEIVNDINAIPDISNKRELKDKAETSGFQIKKSWTMEKIFENLMKTENGQAFLKEFINDKKVLSFKKEYITDLNIVLNHQTSIKRIVDLITMK